MKIFIVNGQGGSGKTSLEQFVGEQHDNLVGATSMIAYVKQIAEKFGWRGQKDSKDRLMLSRLKDLLTDWDDSPFATTCMMVKQMENEGVDCCFIDAREPQDIARLKEKFHCKTILLRRGDQKNYGNHADDEVFNFDYDIEIDNNGTLDDLREKARHFVKTELEEI